MLSHRQLEHFVTVAQELHFSRAADKLGVLAQSAVSVQVQQLEQAIGRASAAAQASANPLR